jgi:GNAT superfamily N-acetyltransferase
MKGVTRRITLRFNPWSVSLIPTPPDPFKEWLQTPTTAGPEDLPFIVRRALPEEFEQIYDTIDTAFGRKRPREVFDWLYRRNPHGTARCWILVERETGTILKTGASFPWPIWRGDEPLTGSLGGDAATLPQWQRKGLSKIRRDIREMHPWYGETCYIAGPNKSSRAVLRGAGRGERVLGKLSGGVALLRGGALLEHFGVPSLLANPVGFVTDAFFSAWPGRATRKPNAAGLRIEEIRRFSSDFDETTIRHMAWPRFWCPHNADFLNWRYLDHPGESYTGLVSLKDDKPEGYAILRLSGAAATLSEFVVESTSPIRSSTQSIALINHAMAVAREAGCSYLNFFATPGWRHWGLFRRAGFLPYASNNQLEAGCKRFEPEVQRLENWQILPGDRDYH